MDRFWERLESLQGKTLQTSTGRKAFDIVAVDRTAKNAVVIIPQSTGKPRSITREEMERAFGLPLSEESLIPSRLREDGVSEANPAYVAAILRAIRARI